MAPPKSVTNVAQAAQAQAEGNTRGAIARKSKQHGKANQQLFASMSREQSLEFIKTKQYADYIANQKAEIASIKQAGVIAAGQAYQNALAKEQARFNASFAVSRERAIASSKTTAQSQAVQERVAYDKFVADAQQKNREQQIIANQAQRDKVTSGLITLGKDPSKLKQATPRYNPKPTTNEEQRAFAREQVAIPVDRAPVQYTGYGSTNKNLKPLTPAGTPVVPGPNETPDGGKLITVKLRDGINTSERQRTISRQPVQNYQGPQFIRGIDIFKTGTGSQVGKAFEEAGGYIFSPFTNILTDIENLSRDENNKKPRIDTVLDKAIEAGYLYIKPGAKDALSSIGLTEPANKRNKREAANAFDAFSKWVVENPKQAIITGQGEIVFGAATAGAFKGAQTVFNVARQTGGLNVVANFISKIELPKITTTFTPPKLPVILNKGGKLDPVLKTGQYGYDIGGQGLVKTNVKVRSLGDDLFELESSNPKANKFVLFSTKTNQITVIEKNNVISTPQKFRLRTNPDDVITAEQKKFGLTQNAPGLFETVGKPSSELTKALKSESLEEFGRIRTFKAEDLGKSPKEWGRFLFGEGSGASLPPAKPIVDIGLAETKSFGGITSQIGKNAPTPTGKVTPPGKREFIQSKPGDDFIKTLKPSKVDYDNIVPKGRESVFKPFKESKIKVTEELPDTGSGFYSIKKFVTDVFTSKRPTTTFVTDVQKNIKFEDPFSKVGAKIKGKKLRPFGPDPPAAKETLTSSKPGAQLTAKQTRDVIKKEFLKEVSAVSKSKTDLGVLSGTIAYATKGIQYQEPIVYPPGTEIPDIAKAKSPGQTFNNLPSATERFGFKDNLDINLQVIPKKISPGRADSKSGVSQFIETKIGIDTSIVPIGKTNTKQVTPQKTKEIIDLGFTDELGIKLDVPEKTTTRQSTTKLITPQTFFKPPPPNPNTTIFPPGPTPYFDKPWYDRSGGSYGSKRPAGKKFLAWNVDANAIGFLPGPELRVGKTQKVFKELDKVQINYDLLKSGKPPKESKNGKKKKKKGKKIDEFDITVPGNFIKI